MNYKRNLMTGLIGLAILAAPITAAAKNNDGGRNNSHQERAEVRNNAPERSNDHARNFPQPPAPRNEFRSQGGARNETRNFAPAPAPRNEFREQGGARTWVPAPEPVRRDAREDRRDGNRDWREGGNDGDRGNRDYRNYDRDRGYDGDDYSEGAPYYVMPEGYAGGACAWARHLRNVYYYDRNTGHPAAAASLLPQLRRAEQRCGGVPYGYNGYSNLW